MNLAQLSDLKRFLGIEFGGITSIPVMAGGSLYTVAPDVVVTDPAGTGFTAVAVLVAGAVSEIRVTNQGYGYTAAASAALVGGDGSGAIAGTPVVQTNKTGQDGLLSALIAGASGLFYQLTARRVLLESDPANTAPGIVEFRDGSGQSRMATFEFPIIAVSGVAVDGTVVDLSSGFATPGYVIDGTRQFIGLRGRCFPWGMSNVEFQYTAGYAVDSAEAAAITDAVVILAATKYKRIQHIDKTSQSLGGQIVESYSTKDVPPEVQTVIDRFCRPMVFGG